MKKARKIITSMIMLALGLCCSGQSANASPYFGKTFTLKQPDNSIVQAKVFGDEYYQDIESIDGYTLCRNDEGWICYANLSSDGTEYIPTKNIYDSSENLGAEESANLNIKKHLRINKNSIKEKTESVKEVLNLDSQDEEKASSNNTLKAANIRPKAFSFMSRSVSENVKGLTILVDFPDTKSEISKDEIDNFFNQSGYSGFSNNGSVKDFFYDVSGGQLTYTNNIVGFYTAKHEKSYYDDNSEYGHACELVTEALTWLKSTGYDFSSLSLDSDGMVRGFNLFYAGTADAGWAKGLWPHQGGLEIPFSADGVQFSKYEMSDIGSDLSIDTVCHENGHLICGYPDLYDYDGDSLGCGGYSIMSGSPDPKNPLPPDAYCRNIISKWNTTYNLNSYDNNSLISVKADSAGAQEVYKWNGSNSGEYYLIENAKRQGRYASLPDEGLLIWHVDENGDNSFNAMTPSNHYLVSLVQADNKFDLENNINYGEDGDLFHKGYKTEFNDTTSPSAKWWEGSNSNLDISNISDIGTTMTFVKSANAPAKEDKPQTDISNNTNIATNASITTSYCSEWESKNALNDGFEPVSSADRNHDVYGNWPETGSQYVQYKFDKNYNISSSSVYWFSDDGGIKAPASYTIQYWDGSNWSNVENPSSFGTNLDTFNTTTFDTVNTNAIRLQMTSDGSASTGILEWRVFGQEALIEDTSSKDDSDNDKDTEQNTGKDDVITDTPSDEDSKDTADLSGKIYMEMYNINKSDVTNCISPAFKLLNSSDTNLDLSKVKLRYYYTADTDVAQSFWCDWSTIDSKNISGSFVEMPNTQEGADHYLEITFNKSSGILKSGDSIIIQTRFAKNDWSNYTQSNDFSFDSTSDTYKANNNASIYIDDTKVWGNI